MQPAVPFRYRPLLLSTLVALALAVAGGPARSNDTLRAPKARENRMSPAGQRAAQVLAQLAEGRGARTQPQALADAANECGEELECQQKTTKQPGGQAELSIAVDRTGRNIVIGYNDTRGFFTNPYQLSGYIVSHDGGRTFTPDGFLPTDGVTYVYGDPDVKYLGACDFVYSSIGLVATTGPSGPVSAQSMVVHRTRDCGDTWEGPFEVTAATNPNGYFYTNGAPVDAADKEFIDVDPETGRVLMSWSNFTHPSIAPGGVEIRTTYSDDLLTADPPTWSSSVVVAATIDDGQASIPRFAGNGSSRAYIAWRRYPSYFGRLTAFAYSEDNGETWSAPAETSAPFLEMDQVLGNDRINTSPSLAVGRNGDVYLVYASNDSLDGADIVFQRSTDDGQTFTAPVLVNAAPGADRPQWFPWVSTDGRSGRVYVFYYDQGIATSGDLSEVSVTWSDDRGDTWSAPVPLTDRPFKAGWGNNTGQPNLGDYNQAVAQHGTLFAAYGVTAPPPGGFVGSQPNGYFEVPNVDFQRDPGRELDRILPVSLGEVTVSEASTHGHHGWRSCRRHRRHLLVKLPLRNYTTNPLSARTLRRVHAALFDVTPGVEVEGDSSKWYGTLPPGSAAVRTFVLGIDEHRFAPGSPIELRLKVEGDHLQRTTLRHRLLTAAPKETTLLTEDFETLPSGSDLPLDWQSRHGAGANTVPWITSSTFCGSSAGAFHANAEDGGSGSPARWERLWSPAFEVPADSAYVTVDFDVCYNTEDNLPYKVWAWDGFFLRITDLTTGRVVISNLVESFADEFTTGDFEHYPKHLPRSSNSAYFEDMSVWAGDSGGLKHVKMRLPGMQGSTAQLRFEFTQDSNGICANPASTGGQCGVFVDNVVVKSHATH
jgi:hypothetical protein